MVSSFSPNMAKTVRTDSSVAWPSTLCELAMSIAHEANQPLAAIVTSGVMAPLSYWGHPAGLIST